MILGYTLTKASAPYNATSVSIPGGIVRIDTGAYVVAPGTNNYTRLSTGVYQFVFSEPVPGLTYRYTRVVVVDGQTLSATLTKSAPVSGPTPPTFRFVPVLGNPAKADLKIVTLDGLRTIHGDTTSDRGVLYASIICSGNYTVTLYADMARGVRVLAGTTATLGARFALSPPNDAPTGGPSSATCVLNSYTADDTDVVVIPTFAVDDDVLLDPAGAAMLGGFDATYGLAYLHAQAMRELLASCLPGALPHLYPSKKGISAFVAGQNGPEMPDLRNLANAGSLREAAACLVKAKGAEQLEHLEEYKAVAKAARERLHDLIEEIAKANVAETEAREEEISDVGSIEFGSYRARGR